MDCHGEGLIGRKKFPLGMHRLVELPLGMHRYGERLIGRSRTFARNASYSEELTSRTYGWECKVTVNDGTIVPELPLEILSSLWRIDQPYIIELPREIHRHAPFTIEQSLHSNLRSDCIASVEDWSAELSLGMHCHGKVKLPSGMFRHGEGLEPYTRTYPGNASLQWRIDLPYTLLK